VKLGQLLSTRPDILPLAYVDALARLQDRVDPFPFAEVDRIVTSELGVRLSKAFLKFEREPLAAASLGQVHVAVLRAGRTVAVKVQRPGIRDLLVHDLEALLRVAEFLDHHTETGRRYEFARVVDEFRRMLLRELDYRQEARHLALLRENLREFDRIVVPRAVDDYTTSRVLTADYVRGCKITALSPVVRTEIDALALADELFRAYLHQILVDGFVHADPHPGNVFLTEDGRIALLDLGMVARVTPEIQEKLLQLLIAVSEGRGDEAAGVAVRTGEPREDFDEPALRRRVAEVVAETQGASLEQMRIGRTVLLIARAAAECGLRVPPELSLLGKTLLSLDQVGRALAPQFDPNAALRRHSAWIAQRRMRKSVSAGGVLGAALEVRELVQRMPARVNAILERVAANDLEVKVDAIDEAVLMAGFQKIANRITVGLVLAALIVGAALLMRVPTSFQILGYPGLAILCFLGAAVGGVALIVDILFTDEKRRSRHKPRTRGA
jgi:predicted unusual protein kinase regulating ubiquinone biosynthesis (AarF/ABC1/UbiB family)